MSRALIAAFFLLHTLCNHSQSKPNSFTVKYVTEKPIIDGVLDEPLWETAENVSGFQQYFPSDSIPAKYPTIIKMLIDDTTLYVSIIAESIGNKWVTPSLKRDYRASTSDGITLMFDTFNDGTNAFLFGINPFGVSREALISGGGQDIRGFSTAWDVKWQGEAKGYDNYYTAEMAIPLTSFKFKEGETQWRFQSYRFDMQTNERSVWHKVPQNQFLVNLAFMGIMQFEKPLGKSRTPLALIPYINAISEKDFITDDGKNGLKLGADAKISIGNAMNLDVTINPDFSNVEVDDIFTNLTRFELSLPERRQFFVDNNDLFGTFGGSRDANPFFSRRIGIATDTAGNTIENRILGGIRLSGKLSQDWRLGLLSIQTDDDLDNEIASNNNTMLVLQKKVFARSNIGMFYINRQTFKDYDFVEPEDEYNRVLGVDYNLASSSNRWVGKFYAHKSFQPEDNKGNFSTGTFLGRNSKYFNAFADVVYVDKDFRSDLGFVRRTDILKWVTSVQAVFWPKSKIINNYALEFFPIIIWRPGLDYLKSDQDIMSNFKIELQDQSQLELKFNNTFTFLTDTDIFDPTNTEGGLPLPNNTGYHYNTLGLDYRSNMAQVVSYNVKSMVGRFFNGDLYSFEGQVVLRIQPKASISMQLNYDKISLPYPYPSAELWLLSPKVDITFSKSVFWSTLVQYSNQRDNLGINSRLQWRFAPLSDLYIVYNDNYFVNAFSPRYRSINLKLSYWMNI